jgi:hypothetical protein
MSVDFPAPFGPTSPNRLPAGTVSEKPSSPRRLPKVFTTREISIIALLQHHDVNACMNLLGRLTANTCGVAVILNVFGQSDKSLESDCLPDKI